LHCPPCGAPGGGAPGGGHHVGAFARVGVHRAGCRHRSDSRIGRPVMQPRAFTLLELVVALALTTMLAAAATSVLASQRRWAAAQPVGSWRQRGVAVIESDLRQSSAVRTDRGRVQIWCRCGASDAQAGHLPAEIEYAAISAGDRTWLVRSERGLTLD